MKATLKEQAMNEIHNCLTSGNLNPTSIKYFVRAYGKYIEIDRRMRMDSSSVSHFQLQVSLNPDTYGKELNQSNKTADLVLLKDSNALYMEKIEIIGGEITRKLEILNSRKTIEKHIGRYGIMEMAMRFMK